MSSLIKASFWITIAELVFNLSGYVVHSVLGRSLGPAEYGRYSLIIAFSTMIVVLVGRGVPIAMSKYLSEVRKSDPRTILSVRRTGARLQFLIIGVTTIVYFFLSPFFAKVLRDESLIPLFRLSSLIIPAFALASFYVYYFNGIHKFNSQSFIKFYRGVSKIVIIIAFAVFLKVPGAIIGHALVPFSVFIFAFFLDPFKKYKATKKSPVTWQKLLKFAWPITIFMIFYEIMISIDLFLVKALLQDDSLTGLYNAALTMARIPFYAFYFLTIILLPKISETTSQNDQKKTQAIINSSMRFMFMLLFPAIALLSVFSQSVVSFFYGAKYIQATQPLSILVLGMGFLTVFYVAAFILNGAGKNKIPMTMAIIGAVSNTILGYLLINKLGLNGAAIAFSITAVPIAVYLVWYIHKHLAKFLSLKQLTIYFFASAMIYYLGSVLFKQGHFIFILWSIILLAVYFCILFVVGEFSKKDILHFKKAFSRKQ